MLGELTTGPHLPGLLLARNSTELASTGESILPGHNQHVISHFDKQITSTAALGRQKHQPGS
jgi:hypothetical protein